MIYPCAGMAGVRNDDGRLPDAVIEIMGLKRVQVWWQIALYLAIERKKVISFIYGNRTRTTLT